jgi:hypothetical protein
MGYMSVGRCWPDVQTAAQNYYASFPTVTIPHTDGTFAIVRYVYSASAGSGYGRQVNTYSATGENTQIGVVGDISLQQSMYSPCDYSAPFLDGMTIGWGVAAAMVAAVSFKLLRRALT